MNLTDNNNNFPYDDLPDDYFNNLSDNIMRRIETPRKHRKTMIKRICASAAVVCVMITGGNVLINNNQHKTNNLQNSFIENDFIDYSSFYLDDLMYNETAQNTKSENIESDYWQYVKFNDNLLIETF